MSRAIVPGEESKALAAIRALTFSEMGDLLDVLSGLPPSTVIVQKGMTVDEIFVELQKLAAVNL